MATPGSRLEAVLRAGQARLAYTGGKPKPWANASWRQAPPPVPEEVLQVRGKEREELEALKRLRKLAHERFIECLHWMTSAQLEYKEPLPPELLDEWEQDGREFPDPEVYANRVYALTMSGRDEEALRLMQEGIDQSKTQPAFPPQRQDSNESFVIAEADAPISNLQRAIDGEDSDDDDDDDRGSPPRNMYVYEGEPRNKPVRPVDDGLGDDDDGVEEEEEESKAAERGWASAVKMEEDEDDAAIARRMQAEWNSRRGGRARERPRRMVAGGSSDLRGKSNVKVEEEEWW